MINVIIGEICLACFIISYPYFFSAKFFICNFGYFKRIYRPENMKIFLILKKSGRNK